MKEIIITISSWIIPAIVLLTLLTGIIKKIPVYETFIDGAKDGLKVSYNIFPYLLAIKNQNLIDEIEKQAGSQAKSTINLEEETSIENLFSAFIQDIYEISETEETWKEETEIFKKIQIPIFAL